MDVPKIIMSSREERILVSLVLERRPERILEIGFYHGGSAWRMLQAQRLCGGGRLVSIDKNPRRLPGVDWDDLPDFRLIVGNSHVAETYPPVMEFLRGPVQFALIDGEHSEAGTSADIDRVMEHAAPWAWVLFHDSFGAEVFAAISAGIRRYRQRISEHYVFSTSASVPNSSDIPTLGGLYLWKLRPAT